MGINNIFSVCNYVKIQDDFVIKPLAKIVEDKKIICAETPSNIIVGNVYSAFAIPKSICALDINHRCIKISDTFVRMFEEIPAKEIKFTGMIDDTGYIFETEKHTIHVRKNQLDYIKAPKECRYFQSNFNTIIHAMWNDMCIAVFCPIIKVKG